MAIVRKHIYFSGQVQELDFVTVPKMRREPMILPAGWTICGMAEWKWKSGELSGIERMIQEIEMGSFIRIENYQMEDLPVDEREWSFYSK